MSLRMIHRCQLGQDDPIVDVGAGTSRLIDDLLGVGYRDVSLLDISANALDRVQDRRDDRSDLIERIVANVTTWEPGRSYKLWHDRAVLHFLTEPERRQGYLDALHAGLERGGQFIVATFALGGPEKCSGLPVVRYGADDLAALLGEAWMLQEVEREDHMTPGGRVQPFTWCRFRRD
ncbi:class I SAM-dependent methyltransferase [Rhodovibrio sodomensis]|nr:class I SAM-dependent methyltransferase [Rhodovibrio sodomensis]